MIELSWKIFNINLKRHDSYFKQEYRNIYDGMVCDEISAKILFKTNLSKKIENEILNYWNAISEVSEKIPTRDELELIKIEVLKKYTIFGNNLTLELFLLFQDYSPLIFNDLVYFLKNGLLDYAISELEIFINSFDDGRFIQIFDKIQLFLNT